MSTKSLGFAVSNLCCRFFWSPECAGWVSFGDLLALLEEKTSSLQEDLSADKGEKC